LLSQLEFVFSPAPKAGLALTIRVSLAWLKEPGAAGAVALRLMIWNGYGMERYRPPRRTGVSASTLMGAHGPGSSLPVPRERFHRAFDTNGPSGEVLLPCSRTRRIPNRASSAHPGL